MPGPAAASNRAAAAGIPAADGEESGGLRHEATDGKVVGGGADADRWRLRGPQRKRAGVWEPRLGKVAPSLRDRPGTGSIGANGLLPFDEPPGPGTVAGQAGVEAPQGDQEAVALPGLDP